MRAAYVVLAMIALAALTPPGAADAQDTTSAAAGRDISFGGNLHAGSVCAIVTVTRFSEADSAFGRQVIEHLRTLLGPGTCSHTSSAFAFVTIMRGYTARYLP